MIGPADILLLQGDSITDSGRNREQFAPNAPDGLGHGYVSYLASALAANSAGSQLQVFNRGVGGDGVDNLLKRWRHDCLSLNPTVLSILVGINDVARSVRSGLSVSTSAGAFESTYRDLLQQTRHQLPAVRIVLCEPFALPCGKVAEAWLPVRDALAAKVQRLAEEFSCLLVPFQAMFNEAVEAASHTDLAHDGVHPTIAGHQLMARFWLKHVVGAAAVRVSLRVQN